MKEVKCPNCGRENAGRARNCMFCGFSMKDAAAVAVKETKEPGDSGRWNPEQAYAAGKGRMVFWAVIVLIIAGAVAFLLSYTHGRSELRLPYGIDRTMSPIEVRECMERNGFEPLGSPSGTDYRNQMYGSAYVLNQLTEYSVTAVGDGDNSGQVFVMHVFFEEDEYSFKNPGPVFQDLLAALAQDYGEPEKDTANGLYRWRNGDVFLSLHYAGKTMVELTWAGALIYR